MRSKAAALLATWFGCGYAPIAPGTAGSAAAVAIAYGLQLPRIYLLALTVVMVAPAVWSATHLARTMSVNDPGRVVVDEVLGQWLALLGAPALTLPSCLAGLLLFRLFDIWKPFPIRRLERLPDGYGIVADDLAAGTYAALVLFLLGVPWPY